MTFWKEQKHSDLWIEFGDSVINLSNIIRVRLIKNIIKFDTSSGAWENVFNTEEDANITYQKIVKLLTE